MNSAACKKRRKNVVLNGFAYFVDEAPSSMILAALKHKKREVVRESATSAVAKPVAKQNKRPPRKT